MKEVHMTIKISSLLMALLIMGGIAYAEDFPVIGATYRINRAAFPGKIAVCCTEDAMDKYIEVQQHNDQITMQKMLFEVSTIDDIERIKKANGCMLISSYSQAEIIEKGARGPYIRANFFACPLKSMWGYSLYFGGRVK
jgi:hypothetical protein